MIYEHSLTQTTTERETTTFAALYAPEFNLVEHVWDELREKRFHNRVFDSLDVLK